MTRYEILRVLTMKKDEECDYVSYIAPPHLSTFCSVPGNTFCYVIKLYLQLIFAPGLPVTKERLLFLYSLEE